MAFATKVTRPVNPPAHDSRSTYLGERKICNVLQPEEGGRHHWLTLVLGSGCSTSPDQVSSLRSLIRGVTSSLGPANEARSLDGIPLSSYVDGFLRELVHDRTQSPAVLASDQGKGTEVPTWLVDLAVASALTTHLFAACKALSPVAPLRSRADDKVTVPANSQAMGRYLRRDVVVPALEAIKRSEDQLQTVRSGLAAMPPFDQRDAEISLNWFIARLKALLRRLQSNLNSHEALQLEWSDVDALAEVVWFGLACVAKPGVYPGWTDLMFALSYSAGPPLEDRYRGIRVPTFENLTRTAEAIHRHYLASTREACGRGEAPALYKAAAAALSAEARFRAKFQDHTRRPPPATAFITSFDLELEMAMLHADQDFILVTPAYLVSGGIAHTCWLSVKIKADDASDLGPLLKPAPDRWKVIDDEVVRGSSVPIVIRLAGCPLVSLPSLRDAQELKKDLLIAFDAALRKQYVTGDTEAKAEVEAGLELHHAILLNEYDATWHNSLDLIEAAQRPNNKDTAQSGKDPVVQQRLSLPQKLVGVFENQKWRRFWFLLGVQMQDSAVRNRIMALTSAVPMTVDGDAVLNSGRLGVAVNSRLASTERELLQWTGLDVVAGDAVDVADFGADLEHYAIHLDGAAGGVLTDLAFKEGPCVR